MNTVNLNAQQSATEARASLIAAASGEGTIAAIAAAVVVRRCEAAFLAKASLKALAEALAEASQGRAKAKTFQNYLSLAAQVSSHKDFTDIAADQSADAIAEAMKAKAKAENYGFGIAEVSAMLNGEASPIAAKAEKAKAAKAAKAEAAKDEAEKAAKDPLGYAEEKAKEAIMPLSKALVGLLEGGQLANPYAEDLIMVAVKAAAEKAANGSTKAAIGLTVDLNLVSAAIWRAGNLISREAEAAEAEAADTAKAEAKAAKAKAAKAAAEALAEAAEAERTAAKAAEAAEAEAAEAEAEAAALAAEAAKAKASSTIRRAADTVRRMAEGCRTAAEAAKAKAKAAAEWLAEASEAAEAAEAEAQG